MFAETKSILNKFNIDVSSLLMSSLRAKVICQKYCGNRVISSKIHLFAPLPGWPRTLETGKAGKMMKKTSLRGKSGNLKIIRKYGKNQGISNLMLKC